MGYDVEFVDLVLAYIAQIDGLTDNDRMAILEGVTQELSRDADRFLALYPLTHESLCFRYDYPHLTRHAMYNFDFVGDARFTEMGIIRLVYVDCTTEPHQG